jgi:hypothetical protein
LAESGMQISEFFGGSAFCLPLLTTLKKILVIPPYVKKQLRILHHSVHGFCIASIKMK